MAGPAGEGDAGSQMTPYNPHDLECASAAYGALIELAEKHGNRSEAKRLKRELAQTIEKAKTARDKLLRELDQEYAKRLQSYPPKTKGKPQ